MNRTIATKLALLGLVAACGGGDDDGQPAADAGGGGADSATPDAAGPVEVQVTTYLGTVQTNLDFLAVQDGDGPFTAIEGAGGVYTFEVASGRYAVVWHCVSNGDRISGTYLTTEEATRIGAGCRVTTPAEPHTISGTIAGAGGDGISVRIGSGIDNVVPGDDAYSIANLDSGMYDALAATFVNGDPLRKRIWIQREVAVFQDLDLDIDFTADGSNLNHYSLMAAGADTFQSLFVSGLGTNISLGADETGYQALQTALFTGNELMHVDVSASDGSTSQFAGRWFRTPGDQVLELPDPFDSAVVSAPTTDPYVRLQFDLDPFPDATLYTFFAGGTSAVFQIEVSSAWLGNGASWTFPDLSEASGWNNDWAMGAGEEIGWITTALAANRPAPAVRVQWPPLGPRPDDDGKETRGGSQEGTLIP